MAHRRLRPPTVRLAQPQDAGAISRLSCGHTPWYVRDAVKVVHKAASLLDKAPPGLRVLLFEHTGELAAASVLQPASAPRTVDLVVLAVDVHFQGAVLNEKPPRPLCVAVLEETARFAAREGYERIVAMAANQNEKSVRLITRAGFVATRKLDGDYTLYAATLATDVDRRS